MTPENRQELDLDRLEALADGATAAPWNHFGDRLWGPDQFRIMHGEGDLACWITRHEDAALVTEVRNALPALLREARAAERMRRVLAGISNTCAVTGWRGSRCGGCPPCRAHNALAEEGARK